MKPSFWTIVKRLPRATILYFRVKRLMRGCDKATAKRVAKGFFKLALAWS